MAVDSPTQNLGGIARVQGLLGKIDRLRLPTRSRRDVESILVRQVSLEIDRALPWQAGHGGRTAHIALKIGQAAGLTTDDLHYLKLAALLHDIGLLMLPQELFTGPSPFESESYIAVQNHSRLGAALLEPFTFLKTAAVFVAHHHERWDGTGYPYGIRGPYIPLGARILSVADAFDAITVPAVVCPELRAHIAWRIIRVASGTQFDPEVVQVLARCLNVSAMPDRTSGSTMPSLVSQQHHHEDMQ